MLTNLCEGELLIRGIQRNKVGKNGENMHFVPFAPLIWRSRE